MVVKIGEQRRKFMIDLNQKQKEVMENKVKHGWNTTKIPEEFCYLYGECGEAYDAWLKGKDDLGSELADVALYLMGIAEMLGFSLEDEIEKKMEINRHRIYKKIDGKEVKFDDRTNKPEKH